MPRNTLLLLYLAFRGSRTSDRH
uniref:Uncharacterized protein n=1 Tax=Schistosoma japonicum TaxID=6182 RepID=Q5C5B2_SCHJA|nr:unknown [Schistosoma japonicum]